MIEANTVEVLDIDLSLGQEVLFEIDVSNGIELLLNELMSSLFIALPGLGSQWNPGRRTS